MVVAGGIHYTDKEPQTTENIVRIICSNPIVWDYRPLSDGWVACSLIGGQEGTGVPREAGTQPIMRHWTPLGTPADTDPQFLYVM